MDRSQLHVSFDDGFSNPQKINKPVKKTDFSDRKKSILASTNTRLTENKSHLLDDSLNSELNNLLKNEVDTNKDENKQHTSSKLPVPTDQSSPLLTHKTSTTVSASKSDDTKSKIPIPIADDQESKEVSGNPSISDNAPATNSNVPVEVALKGLIWQPKQSYDVKVPRFNPKSGNTTSATQQTKAPEPLVPIVDIKNKENVTEGAERVLDGETKTEGFGKQSSPPRTDIIDEVKTGKNENIPMNDFKESPFNRRKHSPKHSKIKDTGKSNSGDTSKDESKKSTIRKVSSTEKINDSTKNDIKDTTKATEATETKFSKLDSKEPPKKESQETAKEAVKSKLLLKGSDQSQVKEDVRKIEEIKDEQHKSETSSTVKSSTKTSSTNLTSKDSKEKVLEKKNSKEKLSVPQKQSLKNTHQNTSSAPSTPRKEKKLNRDKIKNAVKATREDSPARSPVRNPAKQKSDVKITKSESNPKPDTVVNIEKRADPVTARDVKVESNEGKETTKTEDEEAKESADQILQELGDKPKSILARVAMKKIASRAAKSGQVPQNGDVKHTNLNDSLNQSKSSGKFALSVPASGKKENEDKEDKASLSSRRDSKFSVDTASRKSVDIRLQNQVILGNKQVEEKQKSPLANTDSWIRSAIPHLPMGVAVLCLLLNIFIPGSGTILSGFAILCCGRARVSSKDDHVMSTVCVNVWVGVAQLFTITFLLVGWFWSLAWGIRMIILAVEYRREQQLQREKQLQTMALSAFGSASNMRSLFP